jgi:hypothetical protein
MDDPHHKLTEEQQIYLVQRVAGFDSPRAIIKSMQEEFGITITHSTVQYYNPGTHKGQLSADRWKTLFDETRKAIIEGRVEVGVANKMVRLRRLETMSQDAMDGGNFSAATKVLAQAAREMGERYAERQNHDQIGPLGSEFSGLTMAELDQRIAASAAKLGLELVPLRGGEPEQTAGREGEAVAPQQTRDPVSE